MRYLPLAILLVLPPVAVSAADVPKFARDVLPVLRKHCLKCHAAKVRKGELNLQTLGGILEGGESGEPAVIPGSPEKSRLLELVSEGKMPPGKSRLSPAEIAVIADWVARGAGREAAGHDALLSPAQKLARRVHFLLEERCFVCHGRKKTEAGLDLRTMRSIRKGGKSGPVIVAGKSAGSLLIKRIADDEMPPRDIRYPMSIHPITESELALFRRWIDGGAEPFPPPPGVVRDDGQLVSDADRKWWAFVPPRKPPVPRLLKADIVRTPVDAFILQRLRRSGLGFSPVADRRTLIRRAFVDLLGLVPSPGQVLAFENDPAPDAWERLVDRLLASPHYGERWGQHWLDAAGYADSEGSVGADPVYPLVWRYRDYVVRSINADKPYDRFLFEQLAGDELEDYRKLSRLTDTQRDNLIATGFLRGGIDATTSPETNFLIDRYRVLADTVEIVSSSLIGLTFRCARCHSHKYDPLPQRDYYRFAAIFAAAYTPYDWIKPRDRFVELVGTQDREVIRKHNAGVDRQVAEAKSKSADLLESFRKKSREKWLTTLKEPERTRVSEALAAEPSKRSDEQKQVLSKFEKQVKPDAKTLAKEFPRYKSQSEALQKQIKALEGGKRKPERGHGLTDMKPQPEPFYLLRRGEWHNRGRQVLPNVPIVLQGPGRSYRVQRPPSGSPTSGNRLALATWLARPDNPLTARVFVNRAWQHHFGRGIVATAEDFGRTGTLPTHPELLDWLAVNFVESGWSLKSLHRLVLTSSVYRQQSRVRLEAETVDPENRLWWRMPLRRLDAEALRDGLLAVAGRLDEQMYGSPVGVDSRSDGQVDAKANPAGNSRRSLYLLHRRSQPVTVLETFDLPRMTTNCIQRRTSNVVSQALLMLHGRFADDQAARLAERVAARAGPDPGAQVERAYREVFGRSPGDEERRLSESFLERQSAAYGGGQAPASPPEITSVLGMHASKGITFDLANVRTAHADRKLSRFEAVAALGYYPDGVGDAHWYVFLDGQLKTSGRLRNNSFRDVRVDLDDKARFLTLVTSSNGTTDTDWTFFGNPGLFLVGPNDKVLKLDLADIVGGGDGTGTGKPTGLDPWTGRVVADDPGGTNGTVNRLHPVPANRFIDGVFVPDGIADGTREIPISTTGLKVRGISAGSGNTWATIRNGHNREVRGLNVPSVAERQGGLVDLCLVLLNSAEFLYVD